MGRVWIGAVATGALAVTLTGCAGGTPPAPTSSTPTTRPTVAAAPPTPTPTASPTSTATTPPEPDPCDGLAPQQSAPADVVDAIGGLTIPELRDTGRLLYAAGEVTLDDSGHPVSYVVAEYDTVFGISQRFCAPELYLQMLNSARRTSFFSSDDSPPVMELYIGDTLNLDPYTVTSVGDENGIAYDWVPVISLPPQR